MLKPHGYALVSDPDALTGVGMERDTITCCHCQRIVFTKPGSAATVYQVWNPTTRLWVEEMGAMCGRCNKPVCLGCHEDGRCRPWERQMERIEARARQGR